MNEQNCANFKPKEKPKPKLVIEKSNLVGGTGDYIVLSYGDHRIELDAPTEYNNDIRLFVNHTKVYTTILK